MIWNPHVHKNIAHSQNSVTIPINKSQFIYHGSSLVHEGHVHRLPCRADSADPAHGDDSHSGLPIFIVSWYYPSPNMTPSTNHYNNEIWDRVQQPQAITQCPGCEGRGEGRGTRRRRRSYGSAHSLLHWSDLICQHWTLVSVCRSSVGPTLC